MAFKHRKLFPSSFVSSPDCLLYYCDQTACSPSCSDIFPLIPPPPPPRHHTVSPVSIALITSFSFFFFFVLYFALLKRDRFSNQDDSVSRRTSRLDQEHQQHLDENLSPVYDNPIWLITTVGLPIGVIESIRAFKYKKDDGLIDVTDCSVCLSEFQEDEMLRILPKCSHAFHINCIDTWLSTHTNCPLCRAPILSPGPANDTQIRTSVDNVSSVNRTEAEHEAEAADGVDQGNGGVSKERWNSAGKGTNSDVDKEEETLSATGLPNSDPETSEGSSGSDK